MQLKIKTKLSLGLGFLFAVIILIGSLGAFYIHRIALASKATLKANYESIEYSKLMLQAADNFSSDSSSAYKKFATNLRLQKDNITEIGEAELTRDVTEEFESLKKNSRNSAALLNMRNAIYRIIDLNMQAIAGKNAQVQATSDSALIYIGIIGGLCIVIVLGFIINFPGYIANPIRELTASIKEIASKKYTTRLSFKSNDEFGELAEAFNSMAERLDQYEHSNLAKIMFEKKRIEAIINNMKDAIVGLNENKIILFANKKAIQLLGLTEKDLEGKYAPDVALTNDLLRKIISPETPSQPLKIFADGKESYFSKENISIISENKTIGEVILLKNVTQFQELDLAKTNFIATISHELKTPLASTDIGLKLLEKDKSGTLSVNQQEILSDLKKDNDRLMKIVGELLDISQAETGKINLDITDVEVTEVIEFTASAMKQQMKEKNIQLKINAGSGSLEIKADKEKAAWVLINIVSNALRYSPGGSSITITAKAESENLARISVSDNGPGIPREYQDKLFQRFYKLPGPEKNVQSSGLGLSISKEFMEAMKGTILLESHPGKGTTVHLFFKKI